jgi:TetR/AcrR family transcriptional regulator
MGEAEDTAWRILASALELFARRGYESTGVQEIAGAAGITKPALYYHFGSKQGLLDAIVLRYGGALLATLREAAVYRHNLVNNLTELFRRTLDFAKNNEHFFRLMVNLFSSAPETCAYAAGKELKREFTAIIEALFTAATADHGNMRARERVYAETFTGLLEKWALLTVNHELTMTADLEYRVIHQYMHGIFS